MRFGSLFSGIGGIDLGLERAGMECAWQVEIDEYARRVLEKHWPEVERYGDVKEVGKYNLEPVDLICGGFPCQDVSVAGKRSGLAGKRSGLWHEFHRILEEMRPEWCVIENVPGLLSSNKGRDFATIIRALAELRYGVAWRILDAQYFGVAQRRRRVFIVGHTGDGRAAEVLFEQQGSSGNTAPSREEGESVTALTQNGVGASGADDNQAQGGHLIAAPVKASSPSRRNGGSWPIAEEFVISPPLMGEGHDASEDGRGRKSLVFDTTQVTSPENRSNPQPGGPCHSLAAGARAPAVAFDANAGFTDRQYPVRSGDYAQLKAATREAVAGNFGVRRLTPTECERLQGFPDGWTEGLSDSARYRALGNAVCVPVAEWIARRML